MEDVFNPVYLTWEEVWRFLFASRSVQDSACAFETASWKLSSYDREGAPASPQQIEAAIKGLTAKYTFEAYAAMQRAVNYADQHATCVHNTEKMIVVRTVGGTMWGIENLGDSTPYDGVRFAAYLQPPAGSSLKASLYKSDPYGHFPYKQFLRICLDDLQDSYALHKRKEEEELLPQIDALESALRG